MQNSSEGFADYLYSSGEYELASLEYLRIVHSNGGDTMACPGSAMKLARCWQELERSADAMALYRYVRVHSAEADLRAGCMMGEASILEETGELQPARELFALAAAEAEDPDISARAEILSSLMYARMGYWSEAADELNGISAGRGSYGDLSARLAATVSRGTSLSRRSPLLCGISSSLLPGSGQMICGHYTDGFIALAVNGAMGWLFYESLQEENTTTSVLIGWLGMSFYGGNILGGIRAAETYNSARRRELLEEVTEILSERDFR
ncbi:MAG: hypothetical protein GF388_06860 [Candidatus Aegiribacteria sp.]|nr:hypothetical protein [Candidatus Aegiribacteria sp.]MBD3294866.1 hypothetical protein [Candidatus Fermentibacteria bacterium]